MTSRVRIFDESREDVPRDHGLFNVNGPSVIRRPEWVDLPGTYLLYFAHHLGSHIRMAWADEIAGPWTVHPGGVLQVADTPAAPTYPHIASPDVHVLADERVLRMYFHAPVGEAVGGHLPCWNAYPTGDQKTLIAESTDGRSFSVVEEAGAIAPSYLRMVPWRDGWLGMAMPTQFVRSADGVHDVEYGPSLFDDVEIRHCALAIEGDELRVWWTRAGDAPERILATTVVVSGDWKDWQAGPVEEVLRPAEAWEGAELEIAPSVRGAGPAPENALRDPYVFTDTDGSRWLFYAAAGEFALGVTPLPSGSRGAQEVPDAP